jgi:sigma-B regulation protein RsbU (phosphoserine phosphatase)
MDDDLNIPKKNGKDANNVDLLERDLLLKQLQINRLLELTQSINNNFSSEHLFKIYQSILSWEMGIKKMMCHITEDEQWKCVSHIGVRDSAVLQDISEELLQYNRMTNLIDNEHPLVSQFDIIIPVYHKERPIAFTMLGDMDGDEDMYEKIQFITTITNIIAVAIENKRLFKRQIEQERLKKEMEVAQNVQKMLIPDVLPSNQHYELDSIYMPHLGVGGDYFDYVPFGENEFGFCIGDISGKGVGAALLMANFQANLRMLVEQRSDKEEFIQSLNSRLLDITKGEKFITFFYAEYCISDKVLKYINAGHNPPILVQNWKVTKLDRGCTLLGTFDRIPSIDMGVIHIESDTLIVTYTDGITDLQNNEGAYFDLEILEQFTLANATDSAKEFNMHLMEYMNEFKGDQPFPDDLSVLTCKIF